MAAWENTLSTHATTPASNWLTSGTLAKAAAGPPIQRCTRPKAVAAAHGDRLICVKALVEGQPMLFWVGICFIFPNPLAALAEPKIAPTGVASLG